MYKVQVRDAKEKSAVILLPGRGGSCKELIDLFDKHLKNIKLIGIEPNIEWYPAPNGPNDQQKAIDGLKKSVKKLTNFIDTMSKKCEIDPYKIHLLGFSAGAVMAIQVATQPESLFNAVILHGAILSPNDLFSPRNLNKFLLLHNKDDKCFSWEERYTPMKKAFQEKGYNIETHENEHGGHQLSNSDITLATDFILNNLKF